MSITAESVQQAKMYTVAGIREAASLSWQEHPVFAGVALKHLITGKDTDGAFSCHVVRVNASCEIGNHIHAGKWELHEVLEGKGCCLLENTEIPYNPGVVTVIPADAPHSVTAKEQLFLLAKFVPALL